ncbi:MAG TPA: bifunctional YncE family protein/alkaline phosphatase family protein [Solirubrobacterales bacterium]
MKARALWGNVALILAVAVALGGSAVAGGGKEEGRIGPETGIQPSGRQLDPVGKLTEIGALPGGAVLTPDGRFALTASAGRGVNDVQIVRVLPKPCPPKTTRERCRKRKRRQAGKVVQKIRMPGLSGGIAVAPDGRTAYVSGVAESGDPDNEVGDDVPGREGDVIHVLALARSGKAGRAGVIEVPPPDGTPPPQSFPPTETSAVSWPRDIAVSPDGETLLVALNLAHQAAIVDTASKEVRFVETGRYPYGAAITSDGRTGLVSNEADGTVSVIDLGSGEETKEITVGPHLSHPEGIAIDPKRPYAYVAVTHQDLIAVIDTDAMEVERTLSVERPQGIGTAPVAVSVTADGCRLLSANSGEDAVAVFALSAAKRCDPGRKRGAGGGRAALANRILDHETRDSVEQSENEAEETAELFGEDAEEAAEERVAKDPVERRSRRWSLVGRVPVASYPTAALATPQPPGKRKLVWVAAKGLGVGPNDAEPGEVLPEDPGSATGGADAAYYFKYLPELVRGMSGITRFPSDQRLGELSPKASRQIRPSNDEPAPPDTPLTAGGPIDHVFYVVRENRTYDQILGDDPRGDGDPKLNLFGPDVTPNAHALAERFPLLDHVYANSEASIDGHFWTSAASVSDYVTKNWHQNYAGRGRPYDFGVYSVTWPATGFLFDQAEDQGISWFNFGEAIAGTVPLADADRRSDETARVVAKFAKSDLGPVPGDLGALAGGQCFANDASSGGTDVINRQEVFDSTKPDGAPATASSRFECFRSRFNQWVAQGSVPAFTYVTLPNDHTNGTTPGSRTPRAMIAENDLALGELVDLISHSPIWDRSLILVIEDDSQDGADHVDAHRIPAFAISPYARRGAVVHTRYDFLSFIRTLELVVGMEPLNLFDATAVPMYDAFDADPADQSEPYDALTPSVDLLERNTASSPNARLSNRLPLEFTDRTPQRILDRILWQSVHGEDAEPPPAGPNAAGIDEERWRRHGAVSDEEALEAALETLGLDEEAVEGEPGG